MENLNDASQAATETVVAESSTFEPTPRSSIDKAFESAFSDEPANIGSDPALESVTPPTTASDRDENGRFKAKEAASDAVTPETTVTPETSPVDAPSRFSPDAKQAWTQTPAPVQAEVKRAFTELEKGLSEYQERFETLRPFEEMAKQAGTSIPAALSNYINLERDLAQNPAQGLQKIFDYIGISPRDYAAQVLGQPVDQNQSAQDSVIRELKAELAAMKQQMSTVSMTIEEQNSAALQNEIAQFAATKPRFEELRQTMGSLMQSGLAQGMDDAYEMADRLKPAATIASPPAATAAQKTLQPHTPKGSLPVTGAPVSGSNPTNRKPPQSARNAIENAFASLGIG